MDFLTGLPVFADWKDNSYNSIFVIVNYLTKMVYYKPVKVINNPPGLAKVILDGVIRHYDLPDSIVTNKGLFFTSKF